ncbi:MAG TPA: error-prone DNA polymerase, partial [Solirubrobacteraceae bacterium]|nr:error-prone DNA polymerase [Solirubrobacteraceae bacterium]
LALGRFLHEDLHGLPDIDLDFPRDIRERLIPRVHEHYGRDRAALVAAFPTYRVRGAVRELGKVLGLPAGEIERVARGADGWTATEQDILAALPLRGPRAGAQPHGAASAAADGCDHADGRGEHASPRWRWLARLVEQAQGLPRHLSQHPGGMVIATRPLIDCCPVVPAAMEGRQMVQWDKDSCADAGFLKIDLLGLGMLSAVERCVEEIERVRGERIDLSRIPFDDEDTFRAIRVADTVGVFQIESRAQMQSLLRTRPRNLQDLTIQVAIVRPGPIQGGAINPYIERRQRLREEGGRGFKYEIPYEHPTLEPVLAETLGTVIFQDQVMEVAEAFAGFTPGEAAALRRAMSRRRSHASVQSHRQRFLEGAARHARADPHTAQRVWAMVEGFAGFGFPKAHGAAFGLLAYQSTWLRVHYGPEFLCALLNEQPMGFYAPDSLVHEAENRQDPIAVLGVDVNASHVQCTVQDGAVRLGLGYIKGAAKAEMQALVDERERGGPFTGLGELAGRVPCSRATLEQLAWSGACDALTGAASTRDRRTALWQLGLATPATPAGRATPAGGATPASQAGSQAQAGRGRAHVTPGAQATQLALPLELPAAPSLRWLGRWQRLIADYSTSGVTIGEHALAILRERLRDCHLPWGTPGLVTSAQLTRLPSGCQVTVAGLVIARQKPGTAKGTMFLLFEDELGTINLIVPRAVYERHRHLARAEPLLLATGRLERAHQPPGPEERPEEVRPVINVVVRELDALERHLPGGLEQERATASVHRLARPAAGAGEAIGDVEEEPSGGEVGSSIRAAAPPVQS